MQPRPQYLHATWYVRVLGSSLAKQVPNTVSDSTRNWSGLTNKPSYYARLKKLIDRWLGRISWWQAKSSETKQTLHRTRAWIYAQMVLLALLFVEGEKKRKKAEEKWKKGEMTESVRAGIEQHWPPMLWQHVQPDMWLLMQRDVA